MPEEWIVFTDHLTKGIHGQDITTGPGRLDYILRLLTGDAKATFAQKARDITSHTVANIDTALKAMTKRIFSTYTNREQKRYLRRYLKKPTDMKARKFVTRVVELTSLFVHFPSETGDNCECLQDDEVKVIIYHSLPRSLRKQIILKGFDYVEHTIDSGVIFLEERQYLD